MRQVDIAICGAGPVGLTLALFLIKRGIQPEQIALIDATTTEQACGDKRSIALSFGSQQLLQTISAWPINCTEIHQIHVSRRGRFGRTLIDREAQKVPALGYVARYGDIVRPLCSLLNKYAPALTVIRPATVNAITQTENSVQISLSDNQTIEAKIAVQAEGKSAQAKQHHYQQTALVAHVKTSNPIVARAYERFTDEGPLALLPQEDGYALVWCVRSESAAKLLALDEAQFLAELRIAFGERLGRFTAATPRASFPLTLNTDVNATIGRCVSIGNAAQTLHPVAGQGLNLGLRDAFLLAGCLAKSLDPNSLQDFFKARSVDRSATIQLTDQLAQIFTSASSDSVKQTFLGASLGLLDVVTPVQNWLAQRMMFGLR